MIAKIRGCTQVLIIPLLLVAVVCYADAALKQYVTELEKKQALLSTIHEDSETIVCGMGKILEKQNVADASDLRKAEGMAVSAEDLAQIIPPTNRIAIQPHSMCGTLLPESNPAVIKHSKEDGSETND